MILSAQKVKQTSQLAASGFCDERKPALKDSCQFSMLKQYVELPDAAFTSAHDNSI